MLISVAARVHTKNRDFECSVTRIAIAIKNEHARDTSPLQRMVKGAEVWCGFRPRAAQAIDGAFLADTNVNGRSTRVMHRRWHTGNLSRLIGC